MKHAIGSTIHQCCIYFQYKYYKYFESDPIFHKRQFDDLDEERRMTTLRIFKALNDKMFTDEDMLNNPYLVRTIIQSLTIIRKNYKLHILGTRKNHR